MFRNISFSKSQSRAPLINVTALFDSSLSPFFNLIADETTLFALHTFLYKITPSCVNFIIAFDLLILLNSSLIEFHLQRVIIMSCCGGKCGCGSDCKCGSGCNGCSMYPDLSYSERSVSMEFVLASSASDMGYVDGRMTVGGENDCKCGANCSCDNCTCK